MKAEKLLERLEMVRKTGTGKWIARCPAHDDGTPSLSVTEIDSGNRVLIHCHGGCGALDVLESIGLDWSALYPDDAERYRPLWRSNTEQKAIDEMIIIIAEAKRDKGERLNEVDKQALIQAKIRALG
jgi:DNA primase